MKLMLRYLAKYKNWVIFGMLIKLIGTTIELLIPYALEHIIDDVAPTGSMPMVILWGVIMIALALTVRFLNLNANRLGGKVARDCAYEIRTDLFEHSLALSGNQVDEFTLPSLISRMTADSYNVQNFIRAFQTIGIRAPFMLLGGICITLTMDVGLASILCVMAPIMLVIVVFVSWKGIPLYDNVQMNMDNIVRIMRENITGIRVVKALSKEDYEMRRFAGANEEMTTAEKKAGAIMALPGPFMQFALNMGLTLVVVIGAQRVNAGVTQPGVILAFLTYFNMILMGVMALNRVFMNLSKANASANRMQAVIDAPIDLFMVDEKDAAHTDRDGYVVFDHVSFSYGAQDETSGEARRMSLTDIDFDLKKGGSLGIIGPTGCGKTTIANLLMRFYDTTEGHIFLDGKDLRTYKLDDLRRRFGVVFQNDVIFADTIAENITFGREVDEQGMIAAADDARAREFIESYEDEYDHMSAIHGANYSGGQKQRILISRALAAHPDILILDDSSSALDYKTDAALRKAIREHHSNTTSIIVAQRISSIMSLDHIMVLDEGRIIGYGTHEHLMQTCKEYQDIYKTQMGEEE